MAAVYQYRFRVTSSMSFPIDMLRYDSCWPAHETEALEIERGFASGGYDKPITIELRGLSPPTVGRWNSRGWSVEQSVEKTKL